MTPSLNTKPHPARWQRHALALAAALVAAPSAQALDIFTGNTPVFVGAWFNGSFTEVVEFQSAIDWAGWCNARAGATCSNHRYWNVAGNWDNGRVPGPGSDVRVEVGDTVRVGLFDSIHQGPISNVAAAGSLSAAGRIELYGLLRVGNGSIADLHNDRDNAGTLETTGLVTIGLLSSGAGRFQGAGGTTIVQAVRPSPVRGLFEPRVGGGHTLQFSGNNLGTPVAVALEPTARFVNSGALDLSNGSVGLQGTATFAQLPVFVNQGSMQGGGTVSGVKFENQGEVQLGAGQGMAMGNWGVHSGRFAGSVGSTMSFAGIGSAGHSFAAGSQVASLGAVNFGVGNHRVQGAFSAASVGSIAGGALVFDGPRPVIGSLVLGGGGTMAFRNAAGAAIQDLTINGDFTRLDIETGAPLDLQHLHLLLGSFNARAPLSIAGSVEWAHGFFINSQPTTVTGNWQLLAGDRVLRANVSNSGNVSWEGGRFTEWSGRFTHQAGQQFDIWGDFSSAGGVGGKLVNSGTVTKRSGSGRSELAMAFDTLSGTVRALNGTLALVGGGTHADATFAASTGATIELAGGTTFGGQISSTGRLNVSGGDFTLLSGTSYYHAPGNRFDVANVRVNTGAHLSVVDALATTGSVTNFGTFTPSSHVQIGGDFVQQGSFGLNPGKDLFVQGTFSNHQPLTVSDAYLSANALVNHSTLNITGNATFTTGTLDNRGTLVLGPANGFPGVNATISSGVNSGTLRVDGAQVGVSAYDLQNTGLISNEGFWHAGGSFTQYAGGRFDNAGTLALNGTTSLLNMASISNSGSLTLEDGVLAIDAGAQVRGPGSFVQQAGVTHVNGLLRATGGIDIQGGVLKGTGTVEGPLTVGPAGVWRPGNSPGTFTVIGDAAMGGRLEIEVQSLAVHDRLVVSGNFNAYAGSAIDLLFDASFQPVDGDTVRWLQAGGSNLSAAVSSSGLPAYWSATLDPIRHDVWVTYDLANAIPLSGDHLIAAGTVGFNAIPGWNNQPNLNTLQNDGTFSNRAGATTAVTTLHNAGGATVINRGELYAGTLNNQGSFQNRAGSTLSGQTLNNSGQMVNEGTLEAYADLGNAAGAVFEQRGTMRVGGRVINNGRLVLAGRLTGPSGYNGSGDVHIEVGGAYESQAGGWFWTSGGHVRVDGLLAASDIRISNIADARLTGTGRVQGNVLAYGNVEPGNSVGTLTVDGNLQLLGELKLELAGTTEYDRLLVNGNAEVNHATFYLQGAYRPVLGDSFSVLSVSGTLSGQQGWHFLRLVDPLDPTSGWTLWADANGFYDPAVPGDWRLTFAGGTLSVTAVPEPESWTLWASGLGMLGWLAQRRRQKRGDLAVAAR